MILSGSLTGNGVPNGFGRPRAQTGSAIASTVGHEPVRSECITGGVLSSGLLAATSKTILLDLREDATGQQEMREILGKAKTVRELLKDVKYSIDYYQREYRWHQKQVHELVDDLSNKFMEEYDPEHERDQVADYPHYFLGSIIISKKERVAYIVDGQQRLTSLTLLLTLLRNLQREHASQVSVDDLIFSELYGQKSFNLHVDERTEAMNALYEDRHFSMADRSESVRNLISRYRDLEAYFPPELRDRALSYFIDWLLNNVHLMEITAYSDDDAYTIFETMNDRGLSLSPTDMLKGYLLANTDETKRADVNG
ncbi:DUF262 domain-containing protein [Candidatus Palauibacter sp.]|uniref:DUF262 domain-containing protein n=1 Tax=Candidatus Palauibacter sp. TaxID=3101350 RepID=UPI003B5266CC